MMSISRWWQLAIGAVFGTTTVFYLPGTAIMIALVLGLILAWASLNSDGDDAHDRHGGRLPHRRPRLGTLPDHCSADRRSLLAVTC